jgi:uncharacterized protein YqgC (DUF456 family)
VAYWAYYLCLFAVLLVGLAVTIMTLPGLWLMLGATALYAWLTHGVYIGWGTLTVLLVITLMAELIETTSAGAAAKRAGAGRRGMWGAMIGGILGGVFLTIPLWLIGTLIGVCLGSFAGAMIAELTAGQQVGRSALIGVHAAKGRFTGTLLKLGFGCVMFVIVVVKALPVGGSATPARAVPQTFPVMK